MIILVYSIPLLMFFDYLLTVVGSILDSKVYGKHVLKYSYELNPVWINDIKKKKFFNIKHILMMLVIYILNIVIIRYSLFDRNTIIFFQTALFSVFLFVVFKHLSNIVIFTYLIFNKKSIKGKVYFKHDLLLVISTLSVLPALSVLIALYMLYSSPILGGAIFGLFSLFFVNLLWFVSFKLKNKKED